MKWTIIDKNLTTRPASVSEYGKYKPELRFEAKERCVYCAIHESSLGGGDSFHVEHYKPKSKFPVLKEEFENLFYACAICNRFKSNDWPQEPINNHSVPSYPNPGLVDYNTLFDIDKDGKLFGKFTASKYMIEKVLLNRPQLINERKEHFIRMQINSAINEIVSLVEILLKKEKDSTVTKLLHESVIEIAAITKFLNNEKTVSKYRPSEIKRPK